MFRSTTKRVAGALVAAVTLSLVASIAPASAVTPAPKTVKIERSVVLKFDSGWG